MKINLLFSYCLLLLILFPLAGQGQQNSENGRVLPVKGTIRVLFIFAELDCEPCVAGTQGCVLDHNNWPPGELPHSALL